MTRDKLLCSSLTALLFNASLEIGERSIKYHYDLPSTFAVFNSYSIRFHIVSLIPYKLHPIYTC